MNPPRPVFSFKALLLAPLPVPAVFAALFAFGPDVRQPLLGFLLFYAFGLVVSVIGTLALAATLRLMGLFRAPGRVATATAGTMLALLGYVAFAWMMWKSSGPDSGPPEDTFAAWLLRSDDFGLAAAFLIAGLATALLYDGLTRRFGRVAAKAA